MSTPRYLELMESGELVRRTAEANQRLTACDLCPWNCRQDRTRGLRGVCRTTDQARVSSFGPHPGEEAPLSGWNGSGTIFFSWCNMRCQYCQNHDISQMESGKLASPTDIAGMMLKLQAMGCHNINLVTPTHVVPQILSALLIAIPAGLILPLVYNSGGYESVSTLHLLDGVIDIYLPDMKYSSSQIARSYSKVTSYPAVNQAAVQEMYRQVGNLQIDENQLATRGLLVRHLVLPHGLAGSREIFDFLVREISPDTYVNIMDQYRPEHNAFRFEKLKRPVHPEEYMQAVELARSAGLYRFDRLH